MSARPLRARGETAEFRQFFVASYQTPYALKQGVKPLKQAIQPIYKLTRLLT